MNKAPASAPPVGAVIIGGHFQGLGILQSLGERNVPIVLLDKEQCIGRFSRYVKKFARCPDVNNEPLFLEFLLGLAVKENLKGWVIYPTDDETVCFLAKHKEKLEEHYRVTTPPWDIVKYAYDKKLTYILAEKSGVAIPKTFYPRIAADLEGIDITFPAILKPSIKEPFYSRIARKAIRVEDRGQLISEYTRTATALEPSQVLMVQEMLPGGASNLFSVGCLFGGGKMLARVVAVRLRQHPMDFGHATTYAETIDIPELEEIAAKILRAMDFHGMAEVEFMKDPRDGKYKLIEINARFWGWHTLAIGAGVDLPYLAFRERLGEEVKQDGFVQGVKWMHLVTDVPTAAVEVLKGRMKLSDYLASFRGKKQFAVWSAKDPLPFIAELAMLPYLLVKRGF